MLSTGREVFDHLTSHGGLDAARYDSDLIAELKRDLGFPQNDDLARSLEQHGTDPADFLAAFFHVVQPFAVMFADLLGMFERAGAKRTDRNLEIAMSFGDPRRDFGFDLDHFRAMLVTLRRVTSVVERVLWGHDHFWMLHHAFTEGESAADMSVTAPAATEWLRVYREDRAWPRSRLGAPQAGDALLDGLLRRVWRVWAAVTDATAELADDRTALRDRQGSEEPVAGAGLWDPGVLARLDLDDWAAGIVQAAYSRTERLHALVEPQRSEEAAVLIGSLEEVMSSGPMVLEEAAHLEKHLTEFLRLPLWQKRHELYSAWVSTQIIDAMEEADPRIHHSDGRLVFSFAGTHFATLERTDPRLHVWAELRSPLAAPIGKGRKAGIQPDYTITREPIHGAGSAAVVVECKQYGKASPGTFPLPSRTTPAGGRMPTSCWSTTDLLRSAFLTGSTLPSGPARL